jgi:hypothetical protein
MCAVEVKMPPGLEPGQYLVGVALSGSGGGISEQSLHINVRAGWWWAFLTVAAGAVGGILVNAWRTGGRSLLSRLVRIADLRQRASSLANPSNRSDLSLILGRFLAQVADLEHRIRAGEDGTTELASLEKQFATLKLVDGIERAFERISDPASRNLRSLIEPRRQELLGLLDADDRNHDAVESLSRIIAADIAELQSFAAAHTALTDTLLAAEALHARVDRQPNEPDLSLQMSQSRNVLAAALEPLDPRTDTDGLGIRRKKLTDQLKELKLAIVQWIEPVLVRLRNRLAAGEAQHPAGAAEYLKLKAQLPAVLPQATDEDLPLTLRRVGEIWISCNQLDAYHNAEPEEEGALESNAGSLPTLPPVSLSPDLLAVLLVPGSGATVRELEVSRYLWEWGTNIFIFVLIGLGGVWALWIGNSSWGTVADFITAFLAGTATRFAVAQIPPSAPQRVAQ